MPRLPLALTAALILTLGACGELPTPVEPEDPAPVISAKKDPSTRPRLRFDQEQILLDPALTPLALYPLDPDPASFDPFKQNLAQTFTPSGDVTLHNLYLPVACAVDVLVRIQIRAGGPEGAVVWDRNYDPLRQFADGTFVSFQIYGGLPLTGGATYAIVLSSRPRPGATESTCSIIKGAPGDTYAGGQGFQNNPGFSPYWIPFSTFAGAADDLPFRTLVR